MAKNISDFKTALKGGGARPNLFKVKIEFPENVITTSGLSGKDATDRATFLVKSAQIPASNLGVIEIPFRGRMIKVAGDRTFDPWSVTVINDGDFSLRKIFETWSKNINDLSENVSELGYTGIQTSGLSYCKNMEVDQLDRDNIRPSRNSISSTTDSNTSPTSPNSEEKIVRRYKFIDAWPSSISSIDLNYESNNQIEEFTVEFQYQYYTIEIPTSPPRQ